MEMPCPNKSFKTDLNQEKTDWEMLVDALGSEEAAMTEYVFNGFDIPDVNNYPKPIIPKQTFTYPIENPNDLNTLFNQMDLNDEAKQTFEVLTTLSLPEVHYNDFPENITATYQELIKSIPANYIVVSDPVQIDDATIQTLTLINPTKSLTTELPKTEPLLSEIVDDGYNIQEYMNKYSTFFSTTPIEDTENIPVLDNMLTEILTELGVDILQQEGNKEKINELLIQGQGLQYLRPGMEDKVYAFIRFVAQNDPTSHKTSIVLHKDYRTSHLYEEAGHLLVFYLKNLTDVLGTGNITGVERLWTVPPKGATDYLAETDEFKARYNDLVLEHANRISALTIQLKELERDYVANPERFGATRLADGSVDRISGDMLLVEKTLMHPENQEYLKADWQEIMPSGKTRLLDDAETYARIEIVGEILGKALLAQAKGKDFQINTKNKGIGKYLTDLIRKLDYLVKKLFSYRSKAARNAFRAIYQQNIPVTPYNDMMRTIADKFLDPVSIKQIWKEPTRMPTSAFDIDKVTFTTNVYLESISLEHKNELDILLNKIPDFQQKKIDELEKEILAIMNTTALVDRENAIQLAYSQNMNMNISGFNVQHIPQIWTWFYTQNPDDLQTWKTTAEQNAQTQLDKEKAAGKTYTPEQEILRLNILKASSLLDQTQDKLVKEEDLILNMNYYDILSSFVSHINNSIASSFPANQINQASTQFISQFLNILNIPGQPQFFETHQKMYNNFVAKQDAAYTNKLKLNQLVRDINQDNKEKVLRWFILGTKIDTGSTVIEFPPLMSEVEDFTNSMSLKDERITALKNDYYDAYKAYGANDQRTIDALDYLQNERFTNEDYLFYKGKYDYFKNIYNAVINAKAGELFRYKGEKEQYELFKTKAFEDLEKIEKALENHKTDFLWELVTNILKREKGGLDLTDQEYADAYQMALDIPEDLGWFEKNLGLGYFSNDPLSSKIIGDITKKNTVIKQEKVERFKTVEEIFLRNKATLLNNPIIQNYLKKTKTNTLNEIFHEIDKNGERTHYFVNKFYTDEFDKETQENLKNIYESINALMRQSNYTLQIPLGDTQYEKNRRGEILSWVNPMNPYITNELDHLRKLYAEAKQIHDLTYYEARPDKDAIIARKKTELDPFAFDAWKKTVIKTYKKWVTSTTDPGRKDLETVEYYVGELAQPATRLKKEGILMADWGSPKPANKTVNLEPVNFINKEFEQLYSIPEFKELYDETASLQEEAYQMYINKIYPYNYVKSKHSWAFTGDVSDRLARIKAWRKAGVSFLARVKQDIRERFRIADEEVQWLTGPRTVPIRGRVAYENPNYLSDNYFHLLESGWESANNYLKKKKEEYEMETLRVILKSRAIQEKENINEVIYEEDFFGKALQVFKRYIKRTKKLENNNLAEFIDRRINELYYNERVPLGKKWRNASIWTSVIADELQALTSYVAIAGSVFTAGSAAVQAIYRMGMLTGTGKLTQLSKTGNTLDALKKIVTLWRDERKDLATEYYTGKYKTKGTLILEELGLLNNSRIESEYNKGSFKFLADALGYGLMKMANTVPSRIVSRTALESLKWIDEAKTFMSPGQYHSFLQSKATNDVINIKSSRELFAQIPDENSYWEMFEVVEKADGNNTLEVKPQHKDKITPYIKAMVSNHVRSLQEWIDMKVNEVPLLLQHPAVKAIFHLKKYLLMVARDMFTSYHDENTRTYHQSLFSGAWNQLQAWGNFFSSNPNKQKESAFIRQNKSNYSLRESFFYVTSTVASLYALNFIKMGITGLVTKTCFENEASINKPLCKPLIWLDIMVKRTVGEIGSMIDPAKWLQNFDKPIPSIDTTFTLLEYWLGGILQPLFSLASLVMPERTEEFSKKKEKGPYAGMGPIEEAAYKILPPLKTYHQLFNLDGLMQRDQFMAQQLNRPSLTTLLNVSPIPVLGWGPLIGGQAISPYWIDHWLWQNLYNDPRLNTGHPFDRPYPPLKKTKN